MTTAMQKMHTLVRVLGMVPTSNIAVVQEDSRPHRWWLVGCRDGDTVLPRTAGASSADDAVERAHAWATTARERYIACVDWEVRALLDGRKTQIRRPVRLDAGATAYLNSYAGPIRRDPRVLSWCPYGESGGTTWVKEAWWPDGNERTLYRATDKDATGDWVVERWWRASSMPREASRLTLRVVGVRVERLQTITPKDVRAEGLSCWSKDGALWKWGLAERHESGELDFVEPWQDLARSASEAFARYWDRRYRKRPWSGNPWTWVLEVEVQA